MRAHVVRLKPCLWEKLPKRVFLDVSEDVVMSFTRGRVFREGHKHVCFLTRQQMWSCRFVWQAWHFVTFDVFKQVFVCAAIVRLKLPCLWEKL